MKLSLAWIFDHITVDYRTVDIPHLMAELTAKVAEIDDYKEVHLNPTSYTLVEVQSIDMKPEQMLSEQMQSEQASITCYSPEHKKTYTVYMNEAEASRQNICVGSHYVIYTSPEGSRFVQLSDFGGNRPECLGVVSVPAAEVAGDWKKRIAFYDVIIDVDNKALTNRPDLWSHRGFAREIAALIQKSNPDATLLPLDQFLAKYPIEQDATTTQPTAQMPFQLSIKEAEDLLPSQRALTKQPCDRFAAAYIESIEHSASILDIAIRLAKVGARPHSAIVDITNYVMFDLGQPMHAFDAATISGRHITARYAQSSEERFALLDGSTIQLELTDCVIADDKGPIALGGIMGGATTAVTSCTRQLLLESAHFQPSVIRKSSTRLKKRTEASIRFEKGLDPNQNVSAILRYFHLLDMHQIPYTFHGALMSIGQPITEPIITVSHKCIEDKLGSAVPVDTIEKVLTALGFGVHAYSVALGIAFDITVPSFRATKDITMPEDIVEEVGRSIGYDTIVPQNCVRDMIPFSTQRIFQEQKIKQHLSSSLAMHELASYAFYDESFLSEISFNPPQALEILNPLTVFNKRLVTSLVPHAISAVVNNAPKRDILRFFELNRIWFMGERPVESLELIGIMYNKHQEINFYDAKQELETLFDMLKLPVTWRKLSYTAPESDESTHIPWYSREAAELYFQDVRIGRAGIIAKRWLEQVVEGQAFLFELDAAFLLSYVPAVPEFKSLEKYQGGYIDISMLMPLTVTVDIIKELLSDVHHLVTSVDLRDVFFKESWGNKRSITVRLKVYNPERTMTGSEITEVKEVAEKALIEQGADIR